jgi:polyisoprenoid-binding protein YceI
MKRLLALLILIPLVSPLVMAESQDFTVDPVHSFVLFTIENRGVGHVAGMFRDISGTVDVDPAAGELTGLDITVKADSVFTNNEKRDEHLRSPDFFDARQFPVIHFKSTSVQRQQDDFFTVTGDLTMHGVTKEVTFDAEYNGHNEKMNLVGGTASLTVDRSDYGMDFLLPNIGDEVTLHLIIEAGQK